jgi:hypothetical protein
MDANRPASTDPARASSPDAGDETFPVLDEEVEEAVVAADDTGLIANERLLMQAEIDEAQSRDESEGNV